MSEKVTVNDGTLERGQQIRKDLTCPICLNFFTDPRTIPCLHTYCRLCIETPRETRSLPLMGGLASGTYCPLCRKIIPCEISSVPTNLMIRGVVEIFNKQNKAGDLSCGNCTEEDAPAVRWCPDCDSALCDVCNSAHSRLKTLAAHKTVTIAEFMDDPYQYLSTEQANICPHHSKQSLDMYCKRCNDTVCRECIKKDRPHQTHDFEFINKVAPVEKEKLKRKVASLEESMEQIRCKAMKVEEYENQLNITHKNSKREIEYAYDEVYRLLEQQKKEELQKVEVTWTSLKMTLASQKENVKLLQDQMVACHRFSNNVMNAENTGPLLTYHKRIIGRVDELIKQAEQSSKDPAHNMVVMCTKPAEVVKSLCDITPVVPLCTTCNLVVRLNIIKLVVTLEDIHGSPILKQSGDFKIHCNGKTVCEELSDEHDGLKIEVLSNGRYQIRYSLERMEDHVISLYCDGRIVKQEEVKLPPSVRDYSNINKDMMIIDKYGPTDKILKFPYLLSKGPDDEIIVNNDATNQLVIFDHQLKLLRVIGGNKFQGITGIAVDNKECLYVADGKSNCIKKFKLDGQFIGQFGSAGTGGGQFRTPFGLHLTTSKLLFVCDRDNDRIQVFKDEQFSYSIGKYGKQPGYFHGPVDLAMNCSEDKLFVTDFQNNRVQVFTPNGDFLKVFGVFPGTNFEVKNPTGIYYTPIGHVIVSSYGTDRILVFDDEEDGAFVSAIEGHYEGKEWFSTPCGVIMRDNGQIVVACSDGKYGNRLVLF